MKQLSTTAENPTPPEQQFPTARYFQVHFQYLQEIIGDLRRQMEKANQQIAELQMQLRLNQPVEKAGTDDGGGNKTERCFKCRGEKVADAAH